MWIRSPPKSACATDAGATSASLWSPKERSSPAKTAWSRKAERKTNSDTLAWAVLETLWRRKLNGAQDLRLAPLYSATFSVAVRQPLSTECWRRATAWERLIWCIAPSSAEWPPCAETKLAQCHWPKLLARIAAWIRK